MKYTTHVVKLYWETGQVMECQFAKVSNWDQWVRILQEAAAGQRRLIHHVASILSCATSEVILTKIFTYLLHILQQLRKLAQSVTYFGPNFHL